MARINIEDSLYKDARFLFLVSKIGLDTALGSLVRAFTVAQEYWVKGCQPIPESAWKKQMLNQGLVDCGLAVLQSDGYYISGSKEQFAWLIKAKESGKKGGEAAANNKNNNLQASDPIATQQQPTSEVYPLPLTPTPPLSLIHSQSLSGEQKPKRKEYSAERKDLHRKIWNSYREEYLRVYQIEPVSNAKTRSQVSQLAERLGPEAVEIVRFYLAHPKSYYVQRTHELGICLSDSETLRTQWLRGKAITERDVKKYQDNQARVELYKAIAEGKI